MKFNLFILFLCFFFVSNLHATNFKKLLINDKIQLDVEVADSFSKQKKGLGNRIHLSEYSGMIFPYADKKERLFWMKNMLISIDIIWIADNKIIYIEHEVPFPKNNNQKLKVYGKGYLSDLILEVKAGFAQRHAIKVGDKIKILDQ